MKRILTLVAVILLLVAALPLTVERDRVRLERMGRQWTLTIDGERKGSLVEPGATPFPIGLVQLFLTDDPGGAQSWQDARLAGDGREETFAFDRDLAGWQGTPGKWRVGRLGAHPTQSGEALLARNFAATGDVVVEATMVSGREGGFVVRSPDGRYQIRLWMRPTRHHDADLVLHSPGHAVLKVPVGPVGTAFGSEIRGLGRRIAYTIMAAAGLALFVAALRQRHPPAPVAAAPRWLLGLVPIAAIALLVVVLKVERGIFEGMPHVQDAVALVFQARNFALGRVASPSAAEPRFFDHEFVVNDGLWFGKYPPGASILYAVALFADGLDWVNPILAAVSLVLIFLLGRLAYGDLEGLIALTFAAVSPFVLLQSASYLSHPTAMAALAAFLWLFLGPARTLRHFGAGLCLAFAILTRPQTAFAIAFPLALLSLPRLRDRADRRPLLACAAASLVGVALFLAYNDAVTGSMWVTPFQRYSPVDRLGFGAVGVEWAGDFRLPKAFGNVASNFEALGPSLSAFGGWFLVLPLLPLLSGSATKIGHRLALSAASLVVLFFFYFHDGIYLGPRYWYEAMPALFVLSARGLTDVVRALVSLLPWRSAHSALVWATAASATVALAVPTARMAARELPQHRGENLVTGTILDAAEAISEPAIVLVDSAQSWQPYGSVYWTLWPELERNRVIWARTGGIYNVHPDTAPIPASRLSALFPNRSMYRWDGASLKRLEP